MRHCPAIRQQSAGAIADRRPPPEGAFVSAAAGRSFTAVRVATTVFAYSTSSEEGCTWRLES